MKLFVGLGNPGKSYEGTRHNIGFEVIDTLVSEFSTSPVVKKDFQGILHKSGELLFLKPQTYMNLSGKSVEKVARFYKVLPDDIIVIHDDIDLPFGALKIKQGGGNGGHNGLKSLDRSIGSGYIRVRMGVGKPPHKSMVADYVLQPFSPEEQDCLKPWISHAVKVCKSLLASPLGDVSTRFTLRSADSLCG